jgi:hypothetical protein
MARIGHYNDKRSDAKGNEPENAEFGRFDGTDYLFVASERSSALAVYDISKANAPGLQTGAAGWHGPRGRAGHSVAQLADCRQRGRHRARSSAARH